MYNGTEHVGTTRKSEGESCVERTLTIVARGDELRNSAGKCMDSMRLKNILSFQLERFEKKILEQIDKLYGATSQRMHSIAKGLSKKRDECMKNDDDANSSKSTMDVITKKPFMLVMQKCLNKRLDNFHMEFSESQDSAILDRWSIELIGEHFYSVSFKFAKIHTIPLGEMMLALRLKSSEECSRRWLYTIPSFKQAWY